MEKGNIVLIEAHEEHGVEWGVSFAAYNPASEDFVRCSDRTEAQKLYDILQKIL
jgi:hypothetical protein